MYISIEDALDEENIKTNPINDIERCWCLKQHKRLPFWNVYIFWKLKAKKGYMSIVEIELNKEPLRNCTSNQYYIFSPKNLIFYSPVLDRNFEIEILCCFQMYTHIGLFSEINCACNFGGLSNTRLYTGHNKARRLYSIIKGWIEKTFTIIILHKFIRPLRHFPGQPFSTSMWIYPNMKVNICLCCLVKSFTHIKSCIY